MLTEEISELEYISPQTASQILQEFYRLTVTEEYLAQGGADYARALLVKAFGEDGARSLLQQVQSYQEARATNLDSLQRADPQQLVMFVEGEHPPDGGVGAGAPGVKVRVGNPAAPAGKDARGSGAAPCRNAPVFPGDGAKDRRGAQ